LLNMRQPGVEVRPLKQITGSSLFSEVFMTDARAERRDLIGTLNQGWEIAQTTLGFERGSNSLGRVTRYAIAFSQLVRAAKELRRGGRPLIEDPVVRAKIGTIYADLEVQRYAGLRVLSARAFLDEHMKPATVRLLWDDPRGESEALWKEMGELGWLGLSLPEAHGGSGLGMVETAILLEEMGHAALPGPYLPTVLAARAIEEAGTNAQRMRWLSAIATGEARATLALLDADLDWRPEGTRTRAEKSATGWTLSGTKRFVPWA